jgi:hypothetical protein
VVASLGARHGIRTELHHGAEGGVVAATWLPAALLTVATERLTRAPAATSVAPDPGPGRRTKRRTEIAGGRGLANRTGMWWSREAAAAMAAARAREPGGATDTAPVTSPTAITAGVNRAGLPIRVPMTARPPTDAGTGPVSGPAPVGSGGTTVATAGAPAARDRVEPDRDSEKLAALYRGIREADGHAGSTHDSDPIHPAGRKG